MLSAPGGRVSYDDGYVPSLPSFGLDGVPLEDAVAEARRGRACHRHPEVDYAAPSARSALFVDPRGVTRGLGAENLVRL